MKETRHRIQQSDGNGGETRRSFLGILWPLLGLTAFVEMVGVVLAYLRPRGSGPAGSGDGTIVEAGPLDAFPPGSVTAFVRGKFYLCRLEDGGLVALSRRCTHLGCTVPWIEEDRVFACPCHASRYDIRGEVLSPPAPRPLDLFPVQIENRVVRVETGRPVRRSRFRSEQVCYPLSEPEPELPG